MCRLLLQSKKNGSSILEQALKKVSEIHREDSRKDKTPFVIVDAQSVKNTDTAEQKGDNEGKKSLILNDISR